MTSSLQRPALGRLDPIDDHTVLVRGQELSVEARQPDVANALVHRTGRTVVVVDTGVTVEFRAALRRAIDGAAEGAERLLLLTTHGHTDHVGNNDVVDEVGAARGLAVEHFVPAADLGQLLDPVGYWTHTFDRIGDLAEFPAPPHLSAAFIVSLFQPLRPFGTTTRTYEELPLQRLELGRSRVNGWSFADGAVNVIRSQGHCAGHVVVHLRDSRLLHLGDEDNGPCGSMADADQVKVQSIFALAMTLIESGLAETVTDGHGDVRRGQDAVDVLDALLTRAAAVESLRTSGSATADEIDGAAFLGRLTEQLRAQSAHEPNPVFTAMIAANALEDAGLRRRRQGPTWSRPSFRNPSPVTEKPEGLALVPAAVDLARWRFQHRQR